LDVLLLRGPEVTYELVLCGAVIMHKQPNKKENNEHRSHTGAYLLPARTPTKKESVCTGTWCIVVVVLNKESSQNIL
jgi:hypothetical protein